MPVIKGNKCLASEFNSLQTEIGDWFSDSTSSITFGDPDQDYGWGGEDSTSVVAIGVKMLASDLNTLVDRCDIGTTICNNVIDSTDSPALSQIIVGEGILAEEYNNIETRSDLIETNRLDIDPLEMSLLDSGSRVRSTVYNSVVSFYFIYTFSEFKKSRYFWNSGGALNFTGTINGYSTGYTWDGEGIDEILSAMGTISMNYTETTQTGSGGNPTGIGYYDLTELYQTIFYQTGTGVYSDSIIAVEAKLTTAIGSVVKIKVSVTPESGKGVDGTTTITGQHRKLDDQSSGNASLSITAPVVS